MRKLMTLIMFALSASSVAAESFTAHYWGGNDYAAPQPVEIKLIALGDKVRMTTRDTPLEELGVTLTSTDLDRLVGKALEYIEYGPGTIQPLGCAADERERDLCVVAERKNSDTQVTFRFRDKFDKAREFYFKSHEMRKLKELIDKLR